MGKKELKSSVSSILIATFSPRKNNVRASTNGMIGPLLFYFLPRVKNLTLIDQPYPGSDIIVPRVEKYQNKRLVSLTKANFFAFFLMPLLILQNKPGTRVFFKVRDFLSVLEVGLKSLKTFDLFIGLESINTLAGIILRKLGRVKKVSYYVSDYSPIRYSPKIFNDLYLWLDRFCAMHADFIWDVSPAIQEARLKVGLDVKKSAPVIPIPNALYKEQINSVDVKKRYLHSAVFVGTLGLDNGPDIAVKAFKHVVKKIPSAKFHIIGGGGEGFEEKYLKGLVKRYNLSKNVLFYGFVQDQKKLSNIIMHFQIALAPYKMNPRSIRLYGDATKIRLYLAAGLPVITTNVPPLGRLVAKKGAAIIVEDNEKALANAIIDIFKDSKKRFSITKNAIAFAKNNTWENTYSTALKLMKLSLD